MTTLWREFYSTADLIFAAAPWEWMQDSEIFGVQDPASGEIGFMQVMGMAGMHFAISRYPGASGLRTLLALTKLGLKNPEAAEDILLGSSQLQIAWEDREDLSAEEKRHLKDLFLKYRGKGSWPTFRTYDPYLLPEHVRDGEKVRTMQVALQQSLTVAQKLREKPKLLPDKKKHLFLVRSLVDGVWQNSVQKVLPAEDWVPTARPIASLAKVKQLPVAKAAFEVELLRMTPVGSDEPGGRPYFPFMVLVVDVKTGFILSTAEMVSPIPDLESMYAAAVEGVCNTFLKLKMRPMEARVKRRELQAVLAPLAEELGMQLKVLKRLPQADLVARSLSGMLGGF